MRRLIPATAVLGVLLVIIVGQAAGIGGSTPTTPSAATPRWVTHVARYPGGISGAVRAVYAARGQNGAASASTKAGSKPDVAGANVQMNDDSNPPLPQNETAVAYNVTNPKIAVAAANDYVSGGVVVMRTSDGGRTLGQHPDQPAVPRDRRLLQRRRPGRCVQPAGQRVLHLAAVLLPRAAVLRGAGLQVGRQRRRPGRPAARLRVRRPTSTTRRARSTTRSSTTRSSSPSTTPRQPALRAALRDLHEVPPAADGFSDYCPIQLSYTGLDPNREPRAVDLSHTAVQPDNPGGMAPVPRPTSSATRWSRRDGTLDVGFVSEDCNDSFDPHLLFQKSTDGGQTFLPNAVQIDKAGQYADFDDGAGRTRSRPRTSAHRTRRRWPTARRPASCCSSTRTTSTGRPRQADISYQTSDRRWTALVGRGVPVDRRIRPARGQRPVLPVGRVGRKRALLRDLVRPPARSRQRADQHLAGGVE